MTTTRKPTGRITPPKPKSCNEVHPQQDVYHPGGHPTNEEIKATTSRAISIKQLGLTPEDVIDELLTPQLSRETLDFLAGLLANTAIQPTADDFEEIAAKMGKARRELIAALAE
jgi:hypothetical protein